MGVSIFSNALVLSFSFSRVVVRVLATGRKELQVEATEMTIRKPGIPLSLYGFLCLSFSGAVVRMLSTGHQELQVKAMKVPKIWNYMLPVSCLLLSEGVRFLVRAGDVRCLLAEPTELIRGMAKRRVVTSSKLIIP